MKLVVDTHTHTVASGHAYSTIVEMAEQASKNGIDTFVITDHGPAMPGGPHAFHFGNMRVIPELIHGIRILKGAEVNIIDYEGHVDLAEKYLKKLDFVIASYHDVCLAPSNKKDHTQGMLSALNIPYVDAVAHPGNPRFQVDIKRVVKEASKLNKLIEINNNSFIVRKGSENNCSEFATECTRNNTRIVCGSDAHICYDVGKFNNVRCILDNCGVPEKLVINTSVEKFESYLRERNQRIVNQGSI